MKAGDGRLAKKIGDGRLAARAGEEGWRGMLANRACGEEGWRGMLVKRAGEDGWQRLDGRLAARADEECWRRKAGEEGWRGRLPSWRNTDRRSRHSGSSTTGAPAFPEPLFSLHPPDPPRQAHETAFFLGVRKGKVFFLALSFEPSGCVGSAPV